MSPKHAGQRPTWESWCLMPNGFVGSNVSYPTLGQVLLTAEQSCQQKTMFFLRGQRHGVQRGEGKKNERIMLERPTPASQLEAVILSFQ